MVGSAERSPTSRGKLDVQRRVEILERYEKWRTPIWVDFDSVIEPYLWEQHKENLQGVLSLLEKSQQLATQLRKLIGEATQRVVTPVSPSAPPNSNP